MKVAVMWWPMSEGGSQQAIRGNVKAFEDHDVDLYLGDETVNELVECADEYDFVLTPFVHYSGDLTAFEDTHLHLQFGGYPVEANIEQTQKIVNAADSVSCLDPSILTDFYSQHLNIDLSQVSVIPNPPNWELFESHPYEASDEFAFIPKIGSEQKQVDELTEVAKNARTEHFESHYVGNNRVDLPDNVTLRPSVPFSHMPNRYRDARVIVNPSRLDVLPNTAFEAFMSHRPYICKPSAIGHVQSIPAEALDTDEFGMSVSHWRNLHEDHIGEADHYVSASRPEDIADAVFNLMTDLQYWHEVTDAADDWLDAWARWSWKDKGELLLSEKESKI